MNFFLDIQITNIVAGRYVFKLTVTDAQGLSSSDTVSVIVHPDALLLNLVEITFTVGVSALTEAEVSSLQQKLVLLLGNNMKLIVRDLRKEQKTGEAILIFYVEQVVCLIKKSKNLFYRNWIIISLALISFCRPEPKRIKF